MHGNQILFVEGENESKNKDPIKSFLQIQVPTKQSCECIWYLRLTLGTVSSILGFSAIYALDSQRD